MSLCRPWGLYSGLRNLDFCANVVLVDVFETPLGFRRSVGIASFVKILPFLIYALLMRYVLGFEGGGTKTECVLMDENGAVVACSRSGASNAVNVGTQGSAAALAEAGKEALRLAAKSPFDVAYILAGVSGAGEPAVREEIQANLRPVFPKATIAVTSDLVLSLAATGEIPSLVVIAGTGSAVLGRTSPLKHARAGGFGPIIGDAGSANDIGRKTVARCFQKVLNKETFLLTDEICRTFNSTWTQFVDLAREQPTKIFPKVFPIVAKAAQSGDLSARAILSTAAVNLIEQVREVVDHLHLRDTDFFLAKTGGVFEGSPFLSEQFDLLLGQMVHNARPGPLPRPGAESAAMIARDALTSPLKIPES